MPDALPQINPSSSTYVTRKVFPAGDWALDEPETSRAVVGQGQRIMWADGETLLVVGDTGNGKSTLTQNIIRAGIGLIPDIIGLAVRPLKSTLYIAADRPSQIKYSLKRMVNEDIRQTWNSHMYVHHGPPPFSLNEQPHRLLPFIQELAEQLDREPFDCLVIDSLKDVVSQMDENEDGIHINQALQWVCQKGVQVAVNVHPRKMGAGKEKERAPILDDIGGNKNIIAGAGSAVFIAAAQDGAHLLYHLKSPAERIDGITLRFDRVSGNISYTEYGL